MTFNLNEFVYAGSKVLCKFCFSDGAWCLAIVSGGELTIPGGITRPLLFKLPISSQGPDRNVPDRPLFSLR